MKKITSILVFFCVLFYTTTFYTPGSLADDLNSQTGNTKIFGDYEYIVEEKNTVTITKYCGSNTDLEIPATIEGIYVTAIGPSAFADNKTLKNVTIPKHVNTLCEESFSNCSMLTTIIFPNKLTTIKKFAFKDCILLTNVHLTENVDTIDGGAFANTPSLTNITVAESNSNFQVTDGVLFDTHDYPLLLYYPCGKPDTTYSLPKGTIEIESYAFYNCIYLQQIELNNGLYEIKDDAFTGCSALTSMFIPQLLYYIGDNAFLGCSSLSQITVHEENASFRVINGVLYGVDFYTDKFSELVKVPANPSLTEYVIPSNVTRIGSAAFSECPLLATITIPDSVASIGKNAFINTQMYTDFLNSNTDMMYVGEHLVHSIASSTEISIKEGTKVIAEHLLDGNPILEKLTVPPSVTVLGSYAFANCPNLKQVDIHEGVQSIDGYTFANCTSLDTINLPISLTNVGYNSFYNTAFYLNESNWADGVLYIDNILFCAKPTVKSCIIRKGTTLIAEDAFSSCKKLNPLEIPEGVTTICHFAFDLTGINRRIMYIYLPKSLKIIYKDSLPERVRTIVGYPKTISEKLAKQTGIRFVNANVFSKPIRFAKRKVVIQRGRKKTIRLKLSKKFRAYFSTKDYSIIQLVDKKKNQITVEGLRKGKAVVTAKIAGRTLDTCKIVVVKRKRKGKQ